MYKPEVLQKYYLFESHPFEPTIDARTQFDFQRQNVSLLTELNVFQYTELKSCFIEVGPFAKAIADLSQYFGALGYSSAGGDQPALLIQGSPGSGRGSMANYAADIVKQIITQSGCGLPSLKTVFVPTESQGKLLILIKQKIEAHLNKNPQQGVQDIFAEYKDLIDPKAPDQSFLEALLNALKTPLTAAPPLILIVDPITWDRRDWIKWLYRLVSPLNVLLIFITEEYRVVPFFDDLVDKNMIQGKSVRLTGLSVTEGLKFAEARLDHFRSTNVDPKVFPFELDAFQKIFTGPPEGRVGVKFLIQVLRGSLNRKMSKLSQSYTAPPPLPTDIRITWADIAESYEIIIRTPR